MEMEEPFAGIPGAERRARQFSQLGPLFLEGCNIKSPQNRLWLRVVSCRHGNKWVPGKVGRERSCMWASSSPRFL